MAKHVLYWDYDRNVVLTCPDCGWTGRGADNEEFFRELLDVKCLQCDRMLLIRFMVCLDELLYGTSDEESRFNAWSDLLFDIDAPKWTIASYFQFLTHPDRYIFFKPTVTQDAAEVCNFELHYRPELNWFTYRSVQRFAEVLRKEIARLEPRDMVDVQSFIWCIAPGKYD